MKNSNNPQSDQHPLSLPVDDELPEFPPFLDRRNKTTDVTTTAVTTTVVRAEADRTQTVVSQLPACAPLALSINLQNRSADLVAISGCASYIRKRIADLNGAEAWVSCGEQLAKLKANLLKLSPRGSNDRIGWVQAFELEPKEFGFNRRHADKLICIYEGFSGHAWPLKKMPVSVRGLLACTKLNHQQIEDAILKGVISPTTTEREIKAHAKLLGINDSAKAKRKASAKQSPKPSAKNAEESQHDRDLQMLFGFWGAACDSARTEFLNLNADVSEANLQTRVTKEAPKRKRVEAVLKYVTELALSAEDLTEIWSEVIRRTHTNTEALTPRLINVSPWAPNE